MMLNPLKLLFWLVVAALEVSLLHLGATLLALAFLGSPALNWFALLLACLIGAWAMGRFETVEGDEERWLSRPLLVILALTMLYTVKLQAGGGWSPLSGWSLLWPFGPNSPNALSLAGLLILQLWAWWRGMGLVDYDHGAVVSTLQRGSLIIVLMSIVIAPLAVVNLGAPPWGPLLATEAVLTVALGLLSLSLARIVADDDRRPAHGWRWFRSSAATALGLLIVGLLLISLFSDTATLVLRAALLLIGGVVAALMSPLAGAIVRLWSWLTTAFGRAPGIPAEEAYPAPAGDLGEAAPLSPAEEQLYQILFTLLTTLMYLVPLAVLLLVILLMRRRRRTLPASDGAVHESLWSWQMLGNDLRSLLAGLRLPRGRRLRDALAQLRGDDPVRRIRRRYIQALLLGESRGRERSQHQTPLEYEPTLESLVPTHNHDLHALTEVYDRARYAPETIQAADATTADAAWAAIQSHVPKENR